MTRDAAQQQWLPWLDDPALARRVLILGVTGSVGVQAVETIAAATDGPPLEIVGAGVGSRWDDADRTLGTDTLPLWIADADARAAGSAARSGAVVASVAELIELSQPDIVLNAVVGFAGFAATIAALDGRVPVALANKESLVAGGPACRQRAEYAEVPILPVDSEHSALLQCLGASRRSEVASLVLTASGGPCFGMSVDELQQITPAEALAHPTWDMGGKISIDSATLFNKGLELIEAMHLFDVAAEDIEVVIHRHSIVHAMTRHVDGSLLAHLGWPDMRVPISHALHWPYRAGLPARELDLVDMPALEFHRPDETAFPALRLSREAAVAGPEACCALNAANEVAVEAFLAGHLAFSNIAAIVADVLHAGVDPHDMTDPEAVAAVDELARTRARAGISKRAVHA